ncbi:MAG: hypothetical protein ABIR79_19935 [Candidatus Binatia bacterium]
MLAADFRVQLENQGFRIGTSEDDIPVLRTEIRRWEPYSADYSMVTVDIDVALIEPGSGRKLWNATRTDWKVHTSNARSRGEASAIAIAETFFSGWQPTAR